MERMSTSRQRNSSGYSALQTPYLVALGHHPHGWGRTDDDRHDPETDKPASGCGGASVRESCGGGDSAPTVKTTKGPGCHQSVNGIAEHATETFKYQFTGGLVRQRADLGPGPRRGVAGRRTPYDRESEIEESDQASQGQDVGGRTEYRGPAQCLDVYRVLQRDALVPTQFSQSAWISAGNRHLWDEPRPVGPVAHQPAASTVQYGERRLAPVPSTNACGTVAVT